MQQETLTAAAVTGAVLPIVIAVAQQRKWSDSTRSLVALLVTVVAGVLVAVLNDVTDPLQVLTAVIATVVTTQATHKGVWKPTGVTGAVEKATTPVHPKKTALLDDDEYRQYLRDRNHD